jgi:putative transposase
MKIEKENSSFDFEAFKNQAIADMKSGKSLLGKEGILNPLMKEFLEAALEGEMDSHMASCLEDSEN